MQPPERRIDFAAVRTSKEDGMKEGTPAMRRIGMVGVAVAALAVGMLGTGSAVAKDSARAAKTKITMEIDHKEPVFVGPSTIKQGTDLQIVNDSNPRKIGPHTFSIVKRKLLPTSKKEGKQCFSKGVCGPIAAAHEFDPQTGKVNKPTVEIGKTGWDKAFSLDHPGDSWYTEKKGAHQTRVVSAKPGTKLFYLCAIHPFMQGNITFDN
jgi:hypothetical protein